MEIKVLLCNCKGLCRSFNPHFSPPDGCGANNEGIIERIREKVDERIRAQEAQQAV